MDLMSSVDTISGVGEKTGKLLNNLGVYTVSDILLFFPRTYLKYPLPTEPNEDLNNQLICVFAKIKNNPKNFKTRFGSKTIATGFTSGTSVEFEWFNSPYISSTIEPGRSYCFYGRLILENKKYKIVHPQVSEYEKYLTLTKELQPIYPLTKGLKNTVVKKAVKEAISKCQIKNNSLPEDIVRKYNLQDYWIALKEMHFPESLESLEKARRRFAFEELFYFILNARLQEGEAISFPNNFDIKVNNKIDECIGLLPFSLTKGQKDCLNEVLNDITGPYITQRLIQGDVGSGKTIVAYFAMLNVVLSGYQAAIMAPTEVLARQHFESFKSLNNQFGIDIPVALFLGSQKQSEKKAMQKIVDENATCFVIGTHALISEGRQFNNLALVITDEQHRFGVKQREALSKKGLNPHMLVMSATPIPRTLAMILYGNMHVSLIKELPAERLPIKTCVIKESKRKTAYKFLSDEIAKGHQIYIICPLVEASETTEAANVTDYTNELKKQFGEKYRISMLHGKMKAAEKNEIMDTFFKGEIDILVSTTVVEVGVNVPNATVIMIENASRFGLAALHQLRGRVGRGKDQSYCILMNSSDNGKDSKRLEIMLKSNDGFFIASEDLKLRGPGDFFGIRQSGEFSFKIADIYNDSEDVKNAASEVDNLLKNDPALEGHKELRNDMNLFLANQLYVL